MIDVLYFSDKDVKQKLLTRVKSAKKLLLVSVLPPHRAAKSPANLEPFMSLEHDFADVLDQVLVVDEGKVEGMWRDPVVDLADALFPDDNKAAYAAARGYFFVLGGKAKVTVKKSNDYDADRERLEQTLAKLTLKRKVPPPPPPPKKAAPKAARTVEDFVVDDPWSLLGVDEDAPLAEVKKAWKSLIVQYHPDKVAHLGPEFRALAEKKTRELMAAWEQVRAAAAEE